MNRWLDYQGAIPEEIVFPEWRVVCHAGLCGPAAGSDVKHDQKQTAPQMAPLISTRIHSTWEQEWLTAPSPARPGGVVQRQVQILVLHSKSA